jgi:hypothetical protein
MVTLPGGAANTRGGNTLKRHVAKAVRSFVARAAK